MSRSVFYPCSCLAIGRPVVSLIVLTHLEQTLLDLVRLMRGSEVVGEGRPVRGAALEEGLSCTGWGGLCFRVGFFVGILGVGWSFRGTKAAVGSGV